jgi:hypothetical protein
MDNFVITFDTDNFKELLIYFLNVLFKYNDFQWSNNHTYIGENDDIYDVKNILIGVGKDFYLDSLDTYKENDYSSFDIKRIYNINNIKDITDFVEKYNIKNFNYNKYISLLNPKKIVYDKGNISNVLYGKKKIIDESIKIKRFNEF